MISPWTSIKQSQTLTTHNANRHCRVRFYTFVGQPLSKQPYSKLYSKSFDYLHMLRCACTTQTFLQSANCQASEESPNSGPLFFGSAGCWSPVSHLPFQEELKTWPLHRFTVTLSHVYSFNSRLLYRSLFCFTFRSFFTVQMVDFDRKGCSQTLPTAHKSHESRGRKSFVITPSFTFVFTLIVIQWS